MAVLVCFDIGLSMLTSGICVTENKSEMMWFSFADNITGFQPFISDGICIFHRDTNLTWRLTVKCWHSRLSTVGQTLQYWREHSSMQQWHVEQQNALQFWAFSDNVLETETESDTGMMWKLYTIWIWNDSKNWIATGTRPMKNSIETATEIIPKTEIPLHANGQSPWRCIEGVILCGVETRMINCGEVNANSIQKNDIAQTSSRASVLL